MQGPLGRAVAGRSVRRDDLRLQGRLPPWSGLTWGTPRLASRATFCSGLLGPETYSIVRNGVDAKGGQSVGCQLNNAKVERLANG